MPTYHYHGHHHALDLQQQINNFNKGIFVEARAVGPYAGLDLIRSVQVAVRLLSAGDEIDRAIAQRLEFGMIEEIGGKKEREKKFGEFTGLEAAEAWNARSIRSQAPDNRSVRYGVA